jgi:hypothetical protein
MGEMLIIGKASTSSSSTPALEYTATIGTTWAGDAAPYTQTITMSGIKTGDDPIVDLILSDDYDISQIQLEEWGKIYRITTSDDAITVYAEEPTSVILNIQLLVSRDKVIDVGTRYYSVTMSTDWVGEIAPYSQTVTVDGILESDKPKIYFDVPDAFEDLESQQGAFAMLYDVETADGAVTFKAKELPEVAFNVTLEVSRI